MLRSLDTITLRPEFKRGHLALGAAAVRSGGSGVSRIGEWLSLHLFDEMPERLPELEPEDDDED